MNKLRLVIFLCLILSVIIMGCDKELTKTDVLVKVVSDGVRIEQAVIYVKDGAKSDPTIPTSQYDRSFGADAKGEANLILPFNEYYILARGYSPSLKKYLSGGVTLRLIKDGSFNSQHITLNVQ